MPLPEPGKFVNEQINQDVVDAISQLIADIGRPIDIHREPIIEDCPNCGWSNTYKRSNNRYNTANPNPLGKLNIPFAKNTKCPVCHGKGKLQGPNSADIVCAIIKNTDELKQFEKDKGLLHNSTCETYALSEAPNFNIFKNATTANIDGQRYRRSSEPELIGLTTLSFVRVIWELDGK